MARQRYQEGRIEKTGKTPKWKGHFYVYDGEGKRHHKAIDLGFCKDKTKADATKELRKIVERETGIVRKLGEGDTFEWFWTERFSPFKAWKPKTRKWIEGIFRRSVLPVIGPMRLADLQKTHVQLLMKKLEGQSYSLSRTVRVYIKLVFEEIVEQGLMLKNPANKVEILADKDKRCHRDMTKEEIDLLLSELDSRDRLIVRVAIVCGLRPAELFGLRWDDFHPETGQLRIDETFGDGEWKPTKTRASNGWVSMPPPIVKQLAAWREVNPDHTLIFSTTRKFDKPLDADDFVTRVLRRAAVRAGIMQPRPEGLPKGAQWVDKKTAVNFQAFRRTCATWCLENGSVKDAQTHLRHVNPATTLEHYTQTIPSSVRRAVEGVDEYFFGSARKPAPTTSLTVQ